MSPHVAQIARQDLAGPYLRLHLLELLVANFDAMDGTDIVATAREAYAFVVGETPARAEPEPDVFVEEQDLSPEVEVIAAQAVDLPTPLATPKPPEAGEAVTSADAENEVQLWTSARTVELERHIAAGLPYAEIAKILGVSPGAAYQRASVSGFTKRYPRARGGKLLYEPYPLDRPWPRPEGRREPGEDSKPTSGRDERKPRKCLHCGKMFPSESAGNRICPKCKPAVAAAYEPVSAKVSA